MKGEEIKFKAVRKPLFVAFMIGVAAGCIFAIVVACMAAFDVAVAFAIAAVLMTGVAFALGYLNIKTYVFTPDGIIVFRCKKHIYRYERADIKELRYVSLSLKYFYRGFDIESRKGGAYCLYIFKKDGSKKILAWLNRGIAQKLKDDLYGKLVVIY